MKRLAALVLLTALVVVLPRPAVSSVPWKWSPTPSAGLHLIPTALGLRESDAVQRSAPQAPTHRQRENTEAQPIVSVVPAAPTHPAVVSESPRPPVPHTASDLVFDGLASTYGEGWDGWIAWPAGPGYELRVCGPGGCRVVTSTDAGPDRAMQRAGRIIDLDVPTFEAVCGANWRMGLCQVEVTILRVPR